MHQTGRSDHTAVMSRRDDIYVGGFQGYDQLDPADSLAGEIGEDPLDAGYTLPDRPPAATRWGNTVDEVRRGESVEQHLEEEEPEGADDDTDEDVDELDEDARAGRLVAPDEGAHGVDQSELTAQDVGRAGWAASAEEAAMHIVEEG
jgi:hypothetical protein